MVHVPNAAAGLPDAAWSKSSHSNPNGSCAELAGLTHGQVALRNSRHPTGPALILPQDVFAALVRAVKTGELDDLL